MSEVVAHREAGPRRFVDMGDGSLAEIVALAGASGASLEAIGQPDDAPWDGVASSASLIAIMKFCGQQLAAINTNTGA